MSINQMEDNICKTPWGKHSNYFFKNALDYYIRMFCIESSLMTYSEFVLFSFIVGQAKGTIDLEEFKITTITTCTMLWLYIILHVNEIP